MPSAGIDGTRGGYSPIPPIAAAHIHPARAVQLTGGVRVGKSLASAMEAVAWSPYSNLIWFGAHSYDLTRQEFDYTVEALISLGWVDPANVSLPSSRYQPCAMETAWGCVIETRTLSDAASSMVARAPDLLIICEPGLLTQNIIWRARERLSTRRGRLWMAGTLENSLSWYSDLTTRWAKWPNDDGGKSLAAPSWENHYSFPGGRDDPEIKILERELGPALFAARVEGRAGMSGLLVFGDLFTGRHIVNVDLIRIDDDGRSYPVEIAVDPGYANPSVYWVGAIQRVGRYIHVIDEIVRQKAQHGDVILEAMTRPWWPQVVGGVVDPWAGASHIFGSSSVIEEWYDQAKILLRYDKANRVSIREAIQRHRYYLLDPYNDEPRILINPRCERMIWEYRHWREHQSDKLNVGTNRNPVDRDCDAMKAMSAYLVDMHRRENIPTMRITGRSLSYGVPEVVGGFSRAW